MMVTERKAHVPADEGVDLGRLDCFERGKRFSDSRLERREGLGGWRRIGKKTPLRTPSMAPRECTAVDFT